MRVGLGPIASRPFSLAEPTGRSRPFSRRREKGRARLRSSPPSPRAIARPPIFTGAVRDSLSNLAASLGAGKDKAAGDSFMLVDLDRAEIEAMVRGDWLARNIVDIVPYDMVREWRAWSGQRADVARIKAAERRLGQPRRSIQKRRTAVRPNPPNRLSFSPARRYGTSASTRLGKRYESLIQRIKPSSSSDLSGRRRLKPRSRAWNEPRGRSWPRGPVALSIRPVSRRARSPKLRVRRGFNPSKCRSA